MTSSACRGHTRFGEGLALLQGHGARDAFVALPQDVRCLAHDLRPLEGRRVTPFRKAAQSRRHGIVEVSFVGDGAPADRLLIRWIKHWRLAAAAGAPLSVDEELCVRVHGSYLSQKCALPEAILSGPGDEIVELARTNLRRLRDARRSGRHQPLRRLTQARPEVQNLTSCPIGPATRWPESDPKRRGSSAGMRK